MKLRLSFAVFALSIASVLSAQDAVPSADAPAAPESAPIEAAPAAAPVDPMAAVGAAFADLAKAKPGDAQAGAGKAAVCAACHGMDGNSSDPQYPRLAGQHEGYIGRQLVLFKLGARPNPIMLGFAAMLSPQDMRDIGAYFATQKPQAGVADETVIADALSPYKGQRIVDVGQKLYRGGDAARGIPACTACHGPAGRGVPGPSYPSLGGQHAGYTTTALKLFKATPAGASILKDPTYTIMAEIAGRLTDEEILALSSYLEGLHNRADAAPATAQH